MPYSPARQKARPIPYSVDPKSYHLEVTEGTTDEYMTRFKSNMVWNTLAREVARYTGYQLVEPFMRPFNNPEYSVSKVQMQGDIFTYTSQAFVMEDTSVAEDIVRGAFSLRVHPKKTASRNFILMNKNSAPQAFLRNWWTGNLGKKGSVQETMGRDPLRRKTDNSAINRAADEESDESSDDFNDSDGDYEFEAGSKCCSCNTELSSSFLEKCLRRNPIDAGMSKDSDCLEAIGSFISRSDRSTATTPETALDHVCRRHLHRIGGFIGLKFKSMTTEKLRAELLLYWAHRTNLIAYKENPQFAANLD